MRSIEKYFRRIPECASWFDIVDPEEILSITPVDIGSPRYLPDRKAIKAAFRDFGVIRNNNDGFCVVFPGSSAGKMLYQSGVDIHAIVGAFKMLFESSVRAWNEREVPMKGHVFHFNVKDYRNYINRFSIGGSEFFIRFTIRRIGDDSSVHASTISEVAVYHKRDGVSADSHPKNSEDDHKTPFTDNKLSYYFSFVNSSNFMNSSCIFIYGAPASGKSTLGKRLAESLGAKFVDLDAAIVEREGKSIPEIFASQGEVAFRDIESDILRDVVSDDMTRRPPAVVSLGGGTLLRDSNRALCEEHGTIFCIDTPSDEELARRIGAAAGSRPLGNKAKERAEHYASFPNRVAAFFDAQSSLVVVGNGIAKAILDGRSIVADETVSKIWSERLEAKPFAIIPSGEENKTPATIADLWHSFAERGLGRKDTVVALGGGVTGDLTGFAAATWMRGISWINVPTTLLSMVDASTGGKTGCDLPEGKNLAGAFHFPKLVVIDADFLTTLPPELIAAGRAEMIKHEAIGGRAVSGQRLVVSGRRLAVSAKHIAANLMVKVRIVREDPYEKLGRRILLNCGHTVAHAVEKATNYGVSHGEAVAIGCVEESRIAARRGIAPQEWPDEFANAFAEAGLATELPDGLDINALVPLMRGDKKRDGDAVMFALPCGWGDVRGVKIDLSKEKLA